MSTGTFNLRFFIAVSLVILTGWAAVFLNQGRTSQDADVLSARISAHLLSLDRASLLFAKGAGDGPADPSILYENGKLVRWSAPINFPLPLIQDRDTLVFWQSPGGQFLQSWQRLPEGRMVVGIFQLIRYYQLPGGIPFQRHHAIFGKEAPLIRGDGDGHPVLFRGRTLFHIDKTPGGRTTPDPMAWAFLAGCLMSLIWLMVVLYDQNRRDPFLFMVVTGLMLAGFRLFMVFSGFPGSSADGALLDPAVFASSFLSENVLNFALNHFFLLVFSLIIHRTAAKIPVITMARLGGWRRTSTLVILAAVTIVGFHLPFAGLRTVFEDSILLPDLTRSIKFDSARITALAAIVTAGVSAWLIVQAVMRLTLGMLWYDGRNIGTTRPLFAVLCFLLSYAVVAKENVEQTFGVSLLLITAFSRIAGKVIHRALRLQQTGGLLLLLLISFCIALGIRSLAHERQQKAMVVFARSIQAERDEFGEYLLSELAKKIRNDAFIRMVAESPFSDKERILRKVYQHHFAGYLSRFSSEGGFHDANGERVEGNTPTTISSLLAGSSRISGNDSIGSVWLRSPSNTTDGLGRSYAVVVPVGTGMVVVTVGMRPTDAGTPWFLRLVNKENDPPFSGGFAYSVLKNGKIIYQSDGPADHSIPKRLKSVIEEEWINENGMDHLAVPMADKRVLVVSGSAYTLGRLLTNLSFYLFIGLVLIAVVRVYGLVLERSRGNSLTYASRIQLYLSLAFILPLVVTAIAAIRNISLEREKQVTWDNRQAVMTLAEEASRIAAEGIGLDRDQLPRTAVLPKDGFIIYDTHGRRMFSSQPEVLETNLMPQLMDPVALGRLSRGERFTAVRQEVAGFAFQGTYAAINAGIPGRPVGWLFVPYFDHYAAAEQARIRVLMSILPIAVLVFLAFMVVSLRMSERLTRPIREISRTLRRTALSSGGVRLGHARSDEMGRMMEAYDQMMISLEQSKRELLARQREADWRDMARQVAHEIRNPLTPIRLKLQRLQQQIRSGGIQPEQASASIDSVLAQTDILSGIAGSFSALAGFPRLQPEAFDAVAETAKAIELFQDQQEGAIVLKPASAPLMVMFDRPFFSRILSNLMLNAFQSREGPVQVEITVSDGGESAIISVRDNGAGVDPSLGDRIFQPRFTTKAGGSGLGLSIARQGLEQGGGRIWFESTPGIGSAFHVELPKADGVTP